MNVAIVDSFFRIRDLKLVYALKKVYGEKINFTLLKTSDTKNNEEYVPSMPVFRIDSTKKAVEQVIDICKKREIDLLHTHNYPDTYGFWGLKVREKMKIPVVHECHDIGYHNSTPQNVQLSKMVMAGVDRIITVGEGMNEYLNKTYNVGKKCHIVYAYPNEDFLPKISSNVPSAYYDGVYQGGINATYIEGSPYNHRYYKDIFTKIAGQGLKIYVYPAKTARYGYNINNVVFRDNISDVKVLYNAMKDFSFGFVGYYKTPSIVMDIADPNKLYEYLSVGLPILAMNYKRISSFVQENGFGVVIDKDTLKLPAGFHADMMNAKKNVMKSIGKFVMEKQASAIYELYQDAMM